MTWDISTGRLKAGLAAGDVSKDTLIQLSMAQALALAEQYCDRQFLYAADAITFYHTQAARYQVTRYPIEAVTTTNTGSYKVHKAGGWVEYDIVVIEEELKFNYTGGYKVLPADLELALWTIFDTVLGANEGAAVTTGGIKSASLTGVGSVQFDVGGATTQSGGAMGGMIPAVASSILDLYRREYA